MPDKAFYDEWIARLEEKLKGSIPELEAAFLETINAVDVIRLSKKEAVRHEAQLKREKAPGKKIQNAKKAVKDEDEKLQAAVDVCREAAQKAYDEMGLEDFLQNVAQDTDLWNSWMTLAILKSLGSKKWAEAENQDQCVDFLESDHELQHAMLVAGGARGNAYPKAIELYLQLQELVQQPSVEPHPVLERLALGIAIQLCVPVVHLRTAVLKDQRTYVDPLARYRHYEAAFWNGELDPFFEHFSVFELRFVADSDALDEELQWGRETLKNYRPNVVYASQPHWRYSDTVRADIPHKFPNWYKGYQSFDQILFCGGKCGPRAWYGRMICKAFGIPTWGAKQHGHAAMARWSENGWDTNLGGGFNANYWGWRCGLHFQLETQARKVLGDEDYLKQILLLGWISYLYNQESSYSLHFEYLPSPDSPWLTLALMKAQWIVNSADTIDFSLPRTFSPSRNVVQELFDAPDTPEEVKLEADDIIEVPAGSPTHPAERNRTLYFAKSILGGRQILTKGPATIEYTIPAEMLKATSYKIVCKLCTIKQNASPLYISIKGQTEEVEVPVPFTEGAWQESNSEEDVVLNVPSDGNPVTLLLVRKKREHQIAIKNVRLIPAS